MAESEGGMMRRSLCVLALLFGVFAAGSAWAHTPIFACYDNGDGTITCEGGFSDGSSAAGVTVYILDDSGAVLQKSKLDEFSELTFDKPSGDYLVKFDAGEGHRVEVLGSEIAQ
jgi:hypothetical protein